jgi:actin-related protein
MALVLSSMLPQPLLSTILDTIFNNFQPPTISLLSAPLLTTVAAGLRAALVVDIGWAETVTTGIYEYREVLSERTIRASKLLSQEMLKLLGEAALSANKRLPDVQRNLDIQEYRKIISFDECEEIVARMAWCRPSKYKSAAPSSSGGLPYIEEEKHDIEASMQDLDITSKDFFSIPLSSTQPPVTLRLPLTSLTKPCENALFADGIQIKDLDDEELPLHLLVYQTLLHLPVDVRSMCMSRIIFTGGGSNLPGLKNRITDEVNNIIQQRGWDPVQGTAIEKLRLNDKLRINRSKQTNGDPTEIAAHEQVHLKPSTNPALDEPEQNPYEDKLRRELNKGTRPPVQGTLRAVESMGSWSGASILSQLKIPAVSIVEREQWLQHGISGATRQGEITTNDQRQSMGPGGIRAGQGDRTSWTLGSWG